MRLEVLTAADCSNATSNGTYQAQYVTTRVLGLVSADDNVIRRGRSVSHSDTGTTGSISADED
jgi:hypothetical protein